MKEPTIAELRERIVLCKLTFIVDSELNRVKSINPVQEVWARIEVKASNVDDTTTGSRPEITYLITIRKQNLDFDCIRWSGKTLYLSRPWYVLSPRFIVLEVKEIAGDRYD